MNGLHYKISISYLFSAENVAKKWSISRQEQDNFACHSQQKCETAQKQGLFTEGIIPVSVPARGGNKTFARLKLYYLHELFPLEEGKRVLFHAI
jgi:acetyl-CoA acetyltransferase